MLARLSGVVIASAAHVIEADVEGEVTIRGPDLAAILFYSGLRLNNLVVVCYMRLGLRARH